MTLNLSCGKRKTIQPFSETPSIRGSIMRDPDFFLAGSRGCRKKMREQLREFNQISKGHQEVKNAIVREDRSCHWNDSLRRFWRKQILAKSPFPTSSQRFLLLPVCKCI
jgi:hypothetical protein